MAKRRKVGNLLALAVLSALVQRPMHPYEMATTLRAWGKEQDMEIKWGSFYTVIRNLDKHQLIEAVESPRGPLPGTHRLPHHRRGSGGTGRLGP